jgi:hypothetical protein
MKRFAFVLIFLPTAALAQQAPPAVQALAAMLQECEAREANVRVGAAMLQADVTSLKGINKDMKKQRAAAQGDATTGNR